jgi:hypothetical protein
MNHWETFLKTFLDEDIYHLGMVGKVSENMMAAMHLSRRIEKLTEAIIKTIPPVHK